MTLDLPDGFSTRQGECPACGARTRQVDDVEGLPIYGCPECLKPRLKRADARDRANGAKGVKLSESEAKAFERIVSTEQ